MSENSKAVNEFFKFAFQVEIDNLLKEGAWDDIETKLLFERYLVKDKRNKKSIVALCQELNMCESAVNDKLRIIRLKIIKWLQAKSLPK